MPDPSFNLDRLADITRRYAAWGREEGGLPLALAGLTLALQVILRVGLTYLAFHLQRTHPIPLSPESATMHAWRGWENFLNHVHPILAIALPVAWVLSKDALRSHLYRSHGWVEPQMNHPSIWTQRICRSILLTAAIVFPILAALDNGGELTHRLNAFELILGLTGCWALPWIGWIRVRGWLEHLMWTPMAMLALLLLFVPASSQYTYLGGPLVVVILYALLLAPAAIGLGLVQHLRYLRLERDLRLQEQA